MVKKRTHSRKSNGWHNRRVSSEWPSPFQQVAPPPPPPAAPAGRSTPDWLLAGGVVIAAIALVAVLGLIVWTSLNPTPTASLAPSPTQVAVTTTPPAPTATSRPSTSTTSPSAIPSATPISGTSGPGSLATVPPEIAAQIDQVVAQMPAIRELDELRDVPYNLISREQFQIDLRALVDEEIDLDLVAAQSRALERLGLLPEGSDLYQMSLDLNGGGISAYYRFDNREFYIIERNQPFGPLERVFVAHEYTHALQDQHFNLVENRITDPSEGDAALAELAVIEGDASTAMLSWATQNLSVDELIEVIRSAAIGTDQQLLDRMPPILVRQLSFPYQEGQAFVTELQQLSGWQAVDQAIQDPPPTTEQILHPEKYAAHEEPAAVLVDDVAEQLGDGWEQAYIDTFGEVNMQVLAAAGVPPVDGFPGSPPTYPHSETVDGWNGDRFAMWEGPAEAWAIAWVTAWDTATDADEFAGRLAELESTFGGFVRITRGADVVVTLLLASDPALLDLVNANIGRGR